MNTPAPSSAPAAPAPSPAPAPAAPAPLLGTPPAAPAGPVVPANWHTQIFGADGALNKAALDTMPPEFADAKGLLGKYANLPEFLKGQMHLQKLASGKAGLQPLAADATPEARAAWQGELSKMLGVPDKPEGYGITKPEKLPDGMVWDEGAVKGFTELAHKHAVTPAAVKDILAFHQAHVEQQMKGYAQQGEQAQATAVAQLKAELPQGVTWEQFTADIERGVQTASRISGLKVEEVHAMAKAGGLVKMSKLFQALSAASGEDRTVTKASPAETSTLEQQIAAIEADPAYRNAGADANVRTRLLEQRRTLLSQLHGVR